MSGVTDPFTPMDIDREPSSQPSSPTINTPQHRQETTRTEAEDHVNGETSPIPPPHSTNPTTSPPTKPALDPEICKAVGNKFFKAKDYQKAIQEYSKGKDITSLLNAKVYILRWA